MSHTRITLRAEHRGTSGVAMDDVYEKTNSFLVEHNLDSAKSTQVYDLKLMIGEVASNFLQHDTLFQNVTIDLRIDSASLEIEVKFRHDGNSFDPFSPSSNCKTILDAADRLKITEPHRTEGSEEHYRFGFRFKLTDNNA